VRDRILRDAKIAGGIHGGVSHFQSEQGRIRSRDNRRCVKEWTSLCSNEVRPEPEPSPAVLPQKMSRFTISLNFLKVRCIDRDFGSRFNRYQGRRSFRLEDAPDGCGILENICVVNLNRMPGSKAERRIFSLASQKNDAMNSWNEFGMEHFEGREIGQRTKRDINDLPILSQRSGQPFRSRRFNSEVFSRSRARMHPGNSSAESTNQICCNRGRCAERRVSIGRANAGNSQIGASQGQQDRERIVHFAKRRSNRSVGVEPNSGRLGAMRGTAEEEEKNRECEL
jgi:hypothetical protein